MILEIQSQEPIEIHASTDGYCTIVQTAWNGEKTSITIIPRLVDQFCLLLKEAKRQAVENRMEFMNGKDSK
jgi:hypothetical protein